MAIACIAAGQVGKEGVFNIGAAKFGSMRETLENLIEHAKTSSKVTSVPEKFAEFSMNITSAIGLSPLGHYHSLMYGKSMYFESQKAYKTLGFKPRYSNDEMFAETYDWYCDNRVAILSGKMAGSKHQSALRQRILQIVPYFL